MLLLMCLAAQLYLLYGVSASTQPAQDDYALNYGRILTRQSGLA